MRTIESLSVCLLGAVSVACSPTEPTPEPAAIEVVLGDQQVGAVGETLTLPLLVRVTNRRRGAVGQSLVSYRLTSGAAVLDSMYEDCYPNLGFGDPLPTVTVETNADGYAWVSATPAWFGSITVQAETSDTLVPPAPFTIYVEDRDAELTLANPYDSDVVAGPQRWQDLWVFLTDGSGDAAPDVPVTWAITSGGGELVGSSGCLSSRSTDSVVVRTSFGGSGVSFQPTAFGVTTVEASAHGVASSVTFTFEATTYEIHLFEDYDGVARFLGPDYTSDATVPLGALVEWWNTNTNARIVSTSAPPGGAPFDSGPMSQGDRVQFVPDAVGTWDYVDQVSGAEGTLTAF